MGSDEDMGVWVGVWFDQRVWRSRVREVLVVRTARGKVNAWLERAKGGRDTWVGKDAGFTLLPPTPPLLSFSSPLAR